MSSAVPVNKEGKMQSSDETITKVNVPFSAQSTSGLDGGMEVAPIGKV